MPRGVRNVQESECRKLPKKRLILRQMGNKGGKTFETWINIGKGDHRGDARDKRTEKHREPIHEIAQRWLGLRSADVELRRKTLLVDAQAFAEIRNLFAFCFEVLIPLVCKNEIETQDPSLDGFQTMPPTIAEILAANLCVQLPGVKMVDAP